MLTTVVIDDELMMQAQKVTGLQNKREVVEEALRTLIQLHQQTQVRHLRGKLKWESDLDEMRNEN